MDEVIADFATATDEDSFWANLERVLTDEVVIAEAQAAGMDWPEFESGRARLHATVRHLAGQGLDAGWITLDERDVLTGEDPQAALAAVRPHAERGIPFPIEPG